MGSVDVFRFRRKALGICTAIVLASSYASAALSVTLEWDANAEPDIAGYKVHYGTSPRTYSVVVDVGNRTSQLLPDLLRGITYYFAVSAYNTAGLESDPSVEVSYAVPDIATLSSSANPALPGQTVTFTFAVVPTLPVIPVTGPILFKVDGAITPVGLLDGRAAFSTSTLGAGVHIVEAEFVDNTDLLGVTKRLRLNQVITRPPVAQPDQIYRFLPNNVKVQIATLLTNDYDLDGDAITLALVGPSSAQGGVVTRRSNWIYYVAPDGFGSNDTFTYSIVDVHGQAVSNTVQVTIADPSPAPNVIVTEDGGANLIRFDGTPGLTYRIDYTESLDPANWQFLGIRTADEFGSFQIVDSVPEGSSPRVYQSVIVN